MFVVCRIFTRCVMRLGLGLERRIKLSLQMTVEEIWHPCKLCREGTRWGGTGELHEELHVRRAMVSAWGGVHCALASLRCLCVAIRTHT